MCSIHHYSGYMFPTMTACSPGVWILRSSGRVSWMMNGPLIASSLMQGPRQTLFLKYSGNQWTWPGCPIIRSLTCRHSLIIWIFKGLHGSRSSGQWSTDFSWCVITSSIRRWLLHPTLPTLQYNFTIKTRHWKGFFNHPLPLSSPNQYPHYWPWIPHCSYAKTSRD